MSSDSFSVLPHVIFDFGGVVFQWRPAALLSRVLSHRIRNEAEAEHWKTVFFQNYSGDWGAFDAGLISEAAVRQSIAARTDLSEEEVQAVIDAVPHELAPQQPTIDVIRRLKDIGHRLFFLSNMPEPYAAHLLRTHEFLSWFEKGVFSCEAKVGKPDARIYELALDAFAVSREQAIFIDDHPANIEASKALGLPAVLFTDADQLIKDLRDRGIRL